MAHLFMLPRELRDMIYNYLYESDVSYIWEKPIEDADIKSVNIECERVPVAKAIIPGSRASEEYLQAAVFKGRQTTIRMSISSLYYIQHINKAPEKHKRAIIGTEEAKELLRSCSHLRLLVQVNPASTRDHHQATVVCPAVMALLQGLCLMNTQFSTVKMGIYHQYESWLMWDPWLLHGQSYQQSKFYFDPHFDHPLRLGSDIKLLQKAEIYRPKPNEDPLNSQNRSFAWTYSQTMAYFYATDGHCEKDRYWTEKELMREFSIKDVPTTAECQEYFEFDSRLRTWSDDRFTGNENFTVSPKLW